MEDTQVQLDPTPVEVTPVEEVVPEVVTEAQEATVVEEVQAEETAPQTLSQEERRVLIPEGSSASPEPVTTGICESTGVYAPLYAVRHHQPGNPHVWLYSEKAKRAQELEIAVVNKLREMQELNPAAVNDPKFVGDLRAQLSQELLG
jgi:hypothetical protein